MLGPHFYYDLIRLARKPRNYYLRCGYLIALMIGWWYVYEGSQPLGGTINDYARLATNFTYALLAFQYAMILLLAPIYLAGTIVEERESRTLELLYQTQLTDHEILLGKFAARVVHPMFFALMSLPMLSIISLWGGISVEFLLVHFAFSLLLILLVGSMCLWVSTTAATYTEAMMLAYVLQIPVLYGAFVLGAVVEAIAGAGGLPWESSPWLLLIGAIPMLGAAAFFYVIALRRFRMLRNMTWMKRSEPPPRPLPRPKPKRPRPKRPRSPSRTIPDNSLLWKETDYNRYAVDLPNEIYWFGFGCFLMMSCVFAIYRLIPEERDLETLSHLLELFSILGYIALLGLICLGLAFQATSSVTHERERNTLDFLLLLPVERGHILFIKWIAPWVRQRMMLLAMLAVPLIGMMTTMFPARTALLMLLLPWPSLLLVNTLGLFLSVVCRRTVTANILLISLLVVGVVIHLLVWDALIFLAHGYIDVLVDDRFPGPETRLHARLMVLGHQTAILLLAGLFAYLAFWRFERQSTEVRSQAG
jgi:ABC-type transport system involved in multi-copper enzyme maturation permease subunit